VLKHGPLHGSVLQCRGPCGPRISGALCTDLHWLSTAESFPRNSQMFVCVCVCVCRVCVCVMVCLLLGWPTETKVESGTSQSKRGTYVNFSNSGIPRRTSGRGGRAETLTPAPYALHPIPPSLHPSPLNLIQAKSRPLTHHTLCVSADAVSSARQMVFLLLGYGEVNSF